MNQSRFRFIHLLSSSCYVVQIADGFRSKWSCWVWIRSSRNSSLDDRLSLNYIFQWRQVWWSPHFLYVHVTVDGAWAMEPLMTGDPSHQQWRKWRCSSSTWDPKLVRIFYLPTAGFPSSSSLSAPASHPASRSSLSLMICFAFPPVLSFSLCTSSHLQTMNLAAIVEQASKSEWVRENERRKNAEMK